MPGIMRSNVTQPHPLKCTDDSNPRPLNPSDPSGQVRTQLTASRKSNAPIAGFNSSTATLMSYYLSAGR